MKSTLRLALASFALLGLVACGDPDPSSISSCRNVDYGELDCDTVGDRLASGSIGEPLRTCLNDYQKACQGSPVVE